MESLDEAIYWIGKGDVQEIMYKEWGRDLSEREMTAGADKIGDYIPWHEATLSAIEDIIAQAPNDNGGK